MDERLKRTGEIFLIPFDKIIINDEINNGRIDFGNIQELADSIEQSSLRVPLLVQKVRGEDKYTLLQGKRRFKAIELLVKKGIDFPGIKCTLAPHNYNIENSLFDQIVLNDGKPYSNLEQGIVFSQLVGRGYSPQEIAKKVGKSVTHINNCIEIASLPKKVQDLVASGSVSGLTAVELSKVVNSEDELITKLQAAVATAPVAANGKKKKVTKKNVKEVSIMSPLKRLEDVKTKLLEEEGVDANLVQFFNKLVARLKAGENSESIIELFK